MTEQTFSFFSGFIFGMAIYVLYITIRTLLKSFIYKIISKKKKGEVY